MTLATALDLLLQRDSGRLTLVDVGARWGADHRWTQLAAKADILGLEPDAEECRRLNDGCPPYVRYLPYALAEANGEKEFFVTREPACSSNYPPIERLWKQYAALDAMTPERIVRVSCRRLDQVLSSEGLGDVSAIKLDTQGSELPILKGAINTLKTCSIIDIEVQFNPLYDGVDLFGDVDIWLRQQGFVLWRLENLVHYAPELVEAARTNFLIAATPAPESVVPVSNGQLFWAQAQYVRSQYPRTGLQYMPLAEAIRPAILCGVYGFWDLAIELIRKTGDNELHESLGEACGRISPSAATQHVGRHSPPG
jgi:FkbM family methyltransferase